MALLLARIRLRIPSIVYAPIVIPIEPPDSIHWLGADMTSMKVNLRAYVRSIYGTSGTWRPAWAPRPVAHPPIVY